MDLRNSLHENPGLWDCSMVSRGRSEVVWGSSGVVRIVQGSFRACSVVVWQSFEDRSNFFRFFFEFLLAFLLNSFFFRKNANYYIC